MKRKTFISCIAPSAPETAGRRLKRAAMTLLLALLTATTAGAADITQNTAVVINSSNKSTYEGKSITSTVPSTSYAGTRTKFTSTGAIVVDGIAPTSDQKLKNHA
ncbi:MAG: hypothetical protein IKN32_07785 [Bacteroidales bacterium]|nr:hypothetical protein [Bacteroidales bacterium]